MSESNSIVRSGSLLRDLYRYSLKHPELSHFGWEDKNVPYSLVINTAGEFVGIRALGQVTKNGQRINKLSVPTDGVRSVDIKPYPLADNASYLFGAPKFKGKNTDPQKASDKEKDRGNRYFQAEASLVRTVFAGVQNITSKAIIAFYDHDSRCDEIYSWLSRQSDGAKLWDKLMSASTLTFSIEGQREVTVVEDAAIRSAWNAYKQNQQSHNDEQLMMSLISGKEIIPAKTHPKIKLGRIAQSSGASLVSFNASAFDSYGKSQNINAPISEAEATAYTAALNSLISSDINHVYVGDTAVIWWSEADDSSEQMASSQLYAQMSGFEFSKQHLFDDATLSRAIISLSRGKRFSTSGYDIDPDKPFHIVGISGSGSRLIQRFYYTNSFGSFVANIQRHYRDTSIHWAGAPRKGQLTLLRILDILLPKRSTSNGGTSNEGQRRHLIDDLMKAILLGYPYPSALVTSVQLVIRSGIPAPGSDTNTNKQPNRSLTPERAALIKAYYLRKLTVYGRQCPKEVLTMELNEQTTNIPYCLGRMFAIYQKIQEEGSDSGHSSIADRMFVGASANPARIFPVLGRLANVYEKKLLDGRRVYLEKKLEELATRVGDCYPTHLSLPEQGSFQLGYYQQMSDLYTPNSKKVATETESETNKDNA
jgi:CRISPR-associated protein Csd1